MKTPIALAALLAALAAEPVLAGPKSCPPGLAKKSPACVPPGLAKKGVTAKERAQDREDVAEREDRDDDRFDRYPYDRWVVLEEGDRVIFEGREYVVVDTDNGTVLRRGDDWYRLPPPGDRYEYVRVGEQVLRVDPETRAVIDMIRLADLIIG